MRNLARQVCVRLTSELHELLKRVTEARGEDVSSFIRRALLKELADLSFLSREERKALGLLGNTSPDGSADFQSDPIRGAIRAELDRLGFLSEGEEERLEVSSS